jgi:hypothetical protein
VAGPYSAVHLSLCQGKQEKDYQRCELAVKTVLPSLVFEKTLVSIRFAYLADALDRHLVMVVLVDIHVDLEVAIACFHTVLIHCSRTYLGVDHFLAVLMVHVFLLTDSSRVNPASPDLVVALEARSVDPYDRVEEVDHLAQVASYVKVEACLGSHSAEADLVDLEVVVDFSRGFVVVDSLVRKVSG